MARSRTAEVTEAFSPFPRLAVRLPEAARLLSISERLANELVKSGRLHSIRARGARLVPVSAIEALLVGDENGGRS